ncbi:MAG TPA: META domain-containing protein [Solirubrobacterales bacterium]|nr:META domain-containing protein [Solirubrobacterales bacterium]
MIRKIFSIVSLAVVGVLPLAATASADDPVLPVESSLRAEPDGVTWPSASEFTYRMTVLSGPDGADFSFHFPHRPWGPADVGGTPFSTGNAVLEGPGELKIESALVADPSPTSCFRGGFGSTLNFYRLTMEPNSQTTVTMPSRLLAAPVAGMDKSIEAVIGGMGSAPSAVLKAPIAIGGTQGVRIVSRFVGANRHSQITRRPGEAFRITGRTVPALKNRMLSFRAEPRFWSATGGPPRNRVLTTVKTDAEGRFRTVALRLSKTASWVLTSRLVKPGSFDPSASCNGTVEIGRKTERATVRTLDGRDFVSTSVKGPGAKPRKIELSFFRGTTYDENMKVISRNGPIMILNAGCNKVGGGYEVRRGRLRWIGPVASTAMGCSDDRTGWISSRLMKGLTARFVGETLLLTGKRGIRIRLKPAG